jgi:hypothetical protein
MVVNLSGKFCRQFLPVSGKFCRRGQAVVKRWSSGGHGVYRAYGHVVIYCIGANQKS